MRKKICAACLVLVVAALSCGLLAGCNTIRRQFTRTQPNLAEQARVLLDGREVRTRQFSGKGTHTLELLFDAPVSFNTVVMDENDRVAVARAQIALDGEVVWEQDEVGEMRAAFLGQRQARHIAITVQESYGTFTIRDVGVYDMPRAREDYRVFTYLITEPDGQALDALDDEGKWEGIRHVTDVILIDGTGYLFNEKGEVYVNDAVMRRALETVRTLNPAARVHVCLLAKTDNPAVNAKEWPKNIIAIHEGAFASAGFVNNILAVIAKYGLDGVGFDYEYPESVAQCARFGRFLQKLKGNLPDHVDLCCAMAAYKLPIPQSAWDAMDYALIMTYDMVGRRNRHSTWQMGTVEAIDIALREGAKREKIAIGLPFYSRPTMMNETGKTLIGYWGSYCDDAWRMTPFTNEVTVNSTYDVGEEVFVESLYYNGVQMIADKSAFAYDSGLGGVFVWNYGCDLPYDDELSLLASINRAVTP